MNQTKLLELYQSMSSQWLRRLDKYVQSEYFNESDSIISMHKYIRTNLNNELLLDKKAAFYQIFQLKKYNDLKMRYFMTRLYSMVEQFIYHETILEKEDVNKQKILFDYFNTKKCTKAYNNLLHEIKKSRQNESELNQKLQYSKDQNYLNWFYQDSLIMQDMSKSLSDYKKNAPKQLYDILTNLDNFYFINKLTYLCSIINNKNVIPIDFEITLKDEILKLLNDNKFNSIPIVTIYSLIYNMLEKNEDITKYEALKEYLYKESAKFDYDELKNIFSFIQNYCIRKINAGQSIFANELFDIYKFALKKKILFYENEISEVNYRNIVVTGLRIGETTWTKDFIEKYKHSLNISVRDNAYTFNITSYYFYLKQYDKVLKLLREVVFTNIYYSNDYRIILLKTYYELDEREAANALLSSFRTYLKRKKIVSESHRIANTNFIKFYKKISNTQRYSKIELNKLKEDINNSKSISNKDWLLNKIDEKIYTKRN